ncbi:DUF4132 domain-containing protein [Oceanospirillum sanctuarii]|uniref:DUF4132 domain-containing protein n=1 Tax=Oceanospirillum sanctuarii TaxID=1434821 RepID=UPI000A35FE19|nr:DUF4132 domain-containing protein [Oceanospirillum sanctuarii]
MNAAAPQAIQLFQDFSAAQSLAPEYTDAAAIEKMAATLKLIESYMTKNCRRIYPSTKLPFKECPEYAPLSKAPAAEKLAFVVFVMCQEADYTQPEPYDADLPVIRRHNIRQSLLDALLRTKIECPEALSFNALFRLMYMMDIPEKTESRLRFRPFSALVMLLEKHGKRCGISDDLVEDLRQILDHKELKAELTGSGYRSHWGPDIMKAAKKLQRMLSDVDAVPYELGTGLVGKLIADDLAKMEQEKQALWHLYFHHTSTATSGKPSKKFLTEANPLMDSIGSAAFKNQVNQWLAAIAAIKIEERDITIKLGNGRDYTYQGYEYIEEHSFNLLKGILWSLSRYHDSQTLKNIALLTEKCFQKIPERGPAAAAVGNAGIYALAQSKGLEGISHLSRLKLRIRQNNTQKLIQKNIEEQAAKQGITPAQIEEIAAPDFGLVDGQRTELFDDYRLVLSHTGVGTATLQWFKPDGASQKSVPAFVKDSSKHKARLKKMQDLAKQVKQGSTTQRDRIDRLYLEQMSWQPESFSKYYLNHGLISLFASRLIWNLDGVPALCHNGQWQNAKGESIFADENGFNAVTSITLWHPLDSISDEVLAWRDRLDQLEIRQPVKQAYREIYILTDAEINTRVYSNRMAAHILKQHQFNSLSALRGWKYSLLGSYDDGRDGEIASKPLPAYNMQAQFWINEILDDNDNFNDAGIWFYVATDQLRFVNAEDEAIPMVDIPPLVLSEVMRDLDLFVGVASVGNDPQWQDGGPDGRREYRDYWQSYSFGDLSEVAKTRKTVLERLLPRLKIRDKVVIDGKFLLVTGTRHTYKIHIGSGNILIAPNDRYLCIVPGRGKDKNVDQVFLPFEGDNGLSIVLSKAFMLVEDDKITDETILSQL